jgi:hypothetical protein
MEPSLSSQTPFILQVSFREVIVALELQVANGNSSLRINNLLEELKSYPQLREGIEDISLIHNNAEIIEHLLSDYFPQALTKNEIKAIGIPFMPLIFNQTKRFQDILRQAGHDFQISIRDFGEHQFYVLNCCMILNKVYGAKLDFYMPLFYDIPTQDGLIKHYRILYNVDSIQILPTEKSIPLEQADIDLLIDNYDDTELWKRKFPPNSWIMKGFSILTLYDATVENAVSVFKEKLLSINTHEFQESINTIFRSIYHAPDIRIGFTLYNEEERRFSKTGLVQKMTSYLLQDIVEGQDSAVLNESSYTKLIVERKFFTISDTDEFLQHHSGPECALVKRLHDQKIKSFVLAPVVGNNTLYGVLEVVSNAPKRLHSVNANTLDVVMPFLRDKMEQLSVELENKIQAYIQDKFTAIHRSISWIFRSEAKKHLAAALQGASQPPTEILFENIYPLYGQVDVKGSSVARNDCVQRDLQFQLRAVLSLSDRLRDEFHIDTLDSERFKIEKLLNQVSSIFKVNLEQDVISYLDTKVHSLLNQIVHPEAISLINNYFSNNSKDHGAFYSFRRKYEFTISTINDSLALILDAEEQQAQNSFPHYYERFKTDGIEHNLYIGDSISPAHRFSKSALYQLRIWQLRVICQMERAHHELMPTLPYPLPVTSLIVVYHSAIAIRFRMDEKRFDVEGSYNIRYEVVKKRIDKARIKNSDERIAASGKVAIIFSSQTEIAEYKQFIVQLQTENLLSNEVEEFDVEDLQGISGLKALRVSVLRSY